ncbi:ferredoxin reductase family protein [Planosporangium flavigriseum]|uniref:Oxidoreductase n=1 Tax=Planosporangium flavigriseum TaxID=373681 RepID=A0A8J3PJZ9_9ACTN|nr:ferredoxin reductase family protein [Planosporangium flavigriseum]NJC65059.1 ferredoxin reductase family protein [Planosporangium flavigriseum]GIG71674.1 oxidoreductase [Planosporangium flavigriseum]
MTATTTRTAGPAAGSAIRPKRGWWPDVIGAVTAFSMLIVVALWVRGRGLQDLGGLWTATTSVGRLAGLISADLLLVQVLLMARVPWIERAYGQDQLARWHRLVGFTSFNLMLAHIMLITVGYAGTAHASVVREAWDLVTTYPGMLLAVAGTAALVMVVVTSVRAARRRLRYESWHLMHLYAYLGVGLALPHQLWTGADFTSSPVATVYWWTAYGVAAGAVLVFRLGLPLWRSMRHRLEVTTVVREAPGVHSVYLRGRDLHRLPVRAGQFLQWRFLTGPGWTRAHPYSLSAAPRPDALRITVKTLGDDSREVAALRPGTKVLIEGPYGRLTADRRTARRVAMIASGVGITPLRALLEELPYAPGDAVLLYRAREAADLVFRGELEHLAAARGVHVRYLLGPRDRDGSWLPAGWGDDAAGLRHLVPDIAHHDVFVCGPDPWMEAVVGAARRARVPADRIHLERFTW